MKNFKIAAVAVLLAGVALAGSIHVWSTNDVLSASDLNGNFAHIHNLMVGGHGPRLVDADVSGGANIAYTKIQANPRTPTAIASAQLFGCLSDGGTCAMQVSSGVSQIKHVSDYEYRVTFSATGTGFIQAAFVSVGGTDACSYFGPTIGTTSANPVTIECPTPYDGTTSAPTLTIVQYLQ